MAIALVVFGTFCALLSALMSTGAIRYAVFVGIGLWLGFGVFAILGLFLWAKIRTNPLFFGWFQRSRNPIQLAFSDLRPHI